MATATVGTAFFSPTTPPISRFSWSTHPPRAPTSLFLAFPPSCSLKSSTKPLLPLRCYAFIVNSSSTDTLPSRPIATTDLFSLFHDLGFDERETDAILRMHPPLESTSLESLRHRVTSLQSIGITGFALHRAVAKHLEILIAPAVGLFLEFIHENVTGLKPAKLERLLVTTHPLLFDGFSARIELLLNQGIPREKLGHVLSNINLHKFLCEKSMEEIEETEGFLRRFGWPEVILRRPLLLNLDLYEQLIPRVEFFVDLGGGDEAAGMLIRKLPALLSYTVEHYQSHMEFWRTVGLSDEQVFKIALVYPSVFSASRERKLQPRIEFLRQFKLSPEDIFKFLVKAPLFLGLSFEDNLSKKLCFLVKLGLKHRTKELVLAIGAATRTSSENLQMVIGVFFSYGMDSDDVLAMCKKHPQVLAYNHETLDKKIEFLVEGMEREVGELLSFPAFLGYNLDERIKHRYEVKKNVRGKGMSLNKLLSISTERFSMTIKDYHKDIHCSSDLSPVEC